MNKNQAVAAQQFLSRVELKGNEVPAFVEIMNALQEIITPTPEQQKASVENKEVEHHQV